MNRLILAVLASGVWVNLSEFLRNELLFKHYWLDKYSSLGLAFPSAPINGAVWVLWGFLFAACIMFLTRRLEFKEAVVLSWVMGFVLMWITIGNMNVLPFGLLAIAIPWSIVEVVVAAIIAQRIARVSGT